EGDTWPVSVRRIGEEVGLRFQALPERVNRLTEEGRKDKLEDARVKLVEADRLARLLDGPGAARLKDSPAVHLRLLWTHDRLRGQPGRTSIDHRSADSPPRQPYYEQAGKRYAGDAELLVDNPNLQQEQRDERKPAARARQHDLELPGKLESVPAAE